MTACPGLCSSPAGVAPGESGAGVEVGGWPTKGEVGATEFAASKLETAGPVIP